MKLTLVEPVIAITKYGDVAIASALVINQYSKAGW